MAPRGVQSAGHDAGTGTPGNSRRKTSTHVPMAPTIGLPARKSAIICR